MVLRIQDAWGAQWRVGMIAPPMETIRLVFPKIAGAGHLEAPHILDCLLKVANDLEESLRFAADDCSLDDIIMQSEAHVLK